MRAVKLAVASACVFAAGAARAQSAEATGTASVEVVDLQKIQIDRVADIAFGQIVKPTAGAYTVTLEPGGHRTGSGGMGGQLVGGTVSTGKFDVVGEGGRTFSITVPATVTLATAGGGTNRELVLTPDAQVTGTLDGAPGQAGTKQVEVAGSLTVPANIESGAYTGRFPVTVGYQ